MRVPIAVQVKTYDIEDAQSRIDSVRGAFLRYLASVPRKSTGSKHGLMGPVGKILSEVKSGRRDPSSLKGYAMRVHEASQRSPSADALEALEQGIDGLVALLGDSDIPVTIHDRILDRLDYGLYFDLRKQAIASKEARRQEYLAFLRNKYNSEAALAAAWNEDIQTFDDLYLPLKSEGRVGKKASAKQQDIAAFWESQGARSTIANDEEDQ
jgi:hypothetical protein